MRRRPARRQPAARSSSSSIAVGATWVFSAVATFVILKVIDLAFGLRVREDVEVEGLDGALHGEAAYTQA